MVQRSLVGRLAVAFASRSCVHCSTGTNRPALFFTRMSHVGSASTSARSDAVPVPEADPLDPPATSDAGSDYASAAAVFTV